MQIPLKTKLNIRFSRFFDRELAQQMDPRQAKFLRWTGMNLRRAGRRNLRMARQKKISELTPEERENWKRQKRLFAIGVRKTKPRRPNASAKPGEAARLQFKPNPLRDGRTGILFSLNDTRDGVVAGPTSFGDKAAEQIENRHPFMKPALEKVRPTIPQTLRRAFAN